MKVDSRGRKQASKYESRLNEGQCPYSMIYKYLYHSAIEFLNLTGQKVFINYTSSYDSCAFWYSTHMFILMLMQIRQGK